MAVVIIQHYNEILAASSTDPSYEMIPELQAVTFCCAALSYCVNEFSEACTNCTKYSD